MNQYDADGETMGFRSSEEFSAYLETAQKQATNNQTNEQIVSERAELVRKIREYQPGSGQYAWGLLEHAAALLEADAQRQPWASKEHFDAAWSAFGATSFEDLHQKLSIHDIKRLFAMFAEVAQQPAMKPLADEQIAKAWAVAEGEHNASASVKRRITRALEAAHGIKEQS